MNHTGVIAVGRELTEMERSLVERLLGSRTEDGSLYMSQLPHLRVVARCSCGCPTVRFGVSGRPHVLTATRTILGEGGGRSPEGVLFGVILHGLDGLVSELEVFPLESDAQFTLPGIELIEIYPS